MHRQNQIDGGECVVVESDQAFGVVDVWNPTMVQILTESDDISGIGLHQHTGLIEYIETRFEFRTRGHRRIALPPSERQVMRHREVTADRTTDRPGFDDLLSRHGRSTKAHRQAPDRD